MKQYLIILALFGGVDQWGLPQDSDRVRWENVEVQYDRRTRTPRWVLEYLPAPVTPGRRSNRFFEEPSVPPEFRSRLADYEGSGYDRGHAAPAADFQNSDPTFTLANIFPQDSTLNRGLWADLEAWCRDKVKDAQVWIVTLPIYAPAKNGVLSTRVLAPDSVAVPTHVGKSILMLYPDGKITITSFIVPNEPPKGKLQDYRVTTDQLEFWSGVDLWSGLNDELEKELEQK